MRFGPLGIWEIVAIVGVALLIFGPTQLPKLARGVGKAVKSARDLKDEVTGAVLDEEAPKRSARGSEPPAAADARGTGHADDAPNPSSDADLATERERADATDA